MRGCGVALVEARVGADMSAVMSHDQRTERGARDAFAFPEHDLEYARIAPDARGQLTRAWRGLHTAQIDVAPLGFRDDLRGDHQDITVARLQRAGADRVLEQRSEIIASCDARQSFDRAKRQLRRTG